MSMVEGEGVALEQVEDSYSVELIRVKPCFEVLQT